MLLKVWVVFVANLAVRVVGIRDWFWDLRVFSHFAITVVLDVLLKLLVVLDFALVLYSFKLVRQKSLFRCADDWTEAVWRFSQIELKNIVLRFKSFQRHLPTVFTRSAFCIL